MQGLEDAVGLPCPFNQFIPTKFTFYSRSPLGPVTEKNDTDPNPLAFQRLDQVHSLRVPTDFIDVVLGEGLDLFEKTHGVKITTCAGNEESSKELRINPDGTNASSASVKELENVSVFRPVNGISSQRIISAAPRVLLEIWRAWG